MHTAPDGSLPRTVWWVFLGIIACTLVAYVAHFPVERPFLKRPRPVSTSDIVQTSLP